MENCKRNGNQRDSLDNEQNDIKEISIIPEFVCYKQCESDELFCDSWQDIRYNIWNSCGFWNSSLVVECKLM